MGRFVNRHVFDEDWLRAADDGRLPSIASQDPRFAAILGLPHFERFVYVLSVLEGFTDQQCATLLGVSSQEIEETRLRALQHFWGR